jgi:hypothetical protein
MTRFGSTASSRAICCWTPRSKTSRSQTRRRTRSTATGPCSSKTPTGNYLADVLIDPTIDYDGLAHKLARLMDAVARGERPMFVRW